MKGLVQKITIFFLFSLLTTFFSCSSSFSSPWCLSGPFHLSFLLVACASLEEKRVDDLKSTWFDNFATSLKFRNVGVPNVGTGPYNNGLWTVFGFLKSQRQNPPSMVFRAGQVNAFPDDLFDEAVVALTRANMADLQANNVDFKRFFDDSVSKLCTRIPLRLPPDLSVDTQPGNEPVVFKGLRMEDQNIASNDALIKLLEKLDLQQQRSEVMRYQLFTVDSNIYKRIYKVVILVNSFSKYDIFLQSM